MTSAALTTTTEIPHSMNHQKAPRTRTGSDVITAKLILYLRAGHAYRGQLIIINRNFTQ